MSQPAWIPYDEPAGPAWDEFVAAHPHGRFIHLTGFKKAVQEVYGLVPNYWLFKAGNAVRAVFPSFFHRPFLSERRLVSQPFSEYGGILIARDAEPEERRAILSGWPLTVGATDKKEGPFRLEIRGFPDWRAGETDMFRRIRLYERADLPLDPGLKLWDKVDYSVRKNVRRARASGLVLSALKTAEDIREVLYPLHLRSLKRLGSPPHRVEYFLKLRENLGDRLTISVAWLGRTPIGALVGWVVGDSVQITDIASDERFFRHRAADLLHFELMDWAIGRGLRLLDFGPVRYEGQRQYKLKWGVRLHEYAYFYFPERKGRGPLSDRSLPARAARALWRFVPSGLAARIGWRLRREIAL